MTEREKWIRLCHDCYIQGSTDAIETVIPALMDSLAKGLPELSKQYVEATLKKLHASDELIESLIKKGMEDES